MFKDNLRKKLMHEFRDLNNQDKECYDIFHIESMATGLYNDCFNAILFYNDDIPFDLYLIETRKLCEDIENGFIDDELILKYHIDTRLLRRIKYTWAFGFFDQWFDKFDVRLNEAEKLVSKEDFIDV